MDYRKEYNTQLKLARLLPSYKPMIVALRLFVISLISIGILNLVASVVAAPIGIHPIPFRFYILAIVIFNVATEMQIVLDNILERYFPIPRKMKLRIITQVVFALLLMVIAHHVVMGSIDKDMLTSQARPGIYMGLITGLLFVTFLANGLTIARFTQKWLDSQQVLADIKREKLRMDYNSLQDQLNPHFLFNNLSVLKSLIIYDNKAAVTFTENFTDVYRYVLQSKDRKLVPVDEELEFVKSYVGLHKERLGDGLKVKYQLEANNSPLRIAPLTLQLLVENAIKHNIASKEAPLIITISWKEERLEVSNGIQRKDSSYSTQTGLSNLIQRYQMLSEQAVIVQETGEVFKVSVPLL
jgi:uncharacterized membrane-anchored protein YhcB (DUF1043 family)